MLDASPPPDRRRSSPEKQKTDRLTYYREPSSAHHDESVVKQDKARQRWKILCLVKTADSAADEETRQERIKDRVDEWMADFMGRVRLEVAEEADKAEGAGGGAAGQDEDASFRDSGLDLEPSVEIEANELSSSSLELSLSRTRSEMRRSRAKERRRYEHDQRRRIKQREKEELDRERKLILEGKMKMGKQHMSDPKLKLHKDLLSVHRRAAASRSVSPASTRARSTSKVKPAKSPKPKRKSFKPNKSTVVKLKWRAMLGGDKKVSACQNGHCNDGGDDDDTETVIASLVYDEKQDTLTAACNDVEEEGDKGVAKKKKALVGNPVFLAFDEARNVDDLFRIAEIWVNPAEYGS